MDGLVPGRVVYYVLSAKDAEEINRRRTTPGSIAQAMEEGTWTVGAQAHVGSEVHEGDVLPAQVIRIWSQETGNVNLKVNLDGSDTFWATTRAYTESKNPGTWHWMFDGQNTRYRPDRVEKA
jgi:hypothetical protein